MSSINTAINNTVNIITNSLMRNPTQVNDNSTTAITLFNRMKFSEAFDHFAAMQRSSFTITMMIKCLYRERNYLDALILFNLFPRENVTIIDLCAEMQYIRARCYYEVAQESLQANNGELTNHTSYTPSEKVQSQMQQANQINNTDFTIQYSAFEFLTNALLIMKTLVDLQNNHVTKFTVFIPQIYFALGNYRAAYAECTRLSTRNLSQSSHAENFLMRARIARHFGDNVTAMNDYSTALAHANETTNYALLAVIYSDVVLSNGLRNGTSHEDGLVFNGQFYVSANYDSENKSSPMMTANYFTLANHYFTLNTHNPSNISSYLMRNFDNTQSIIQAQYNLWITKDVQSS